MDLDNEIAKCDKKLDLVRLNLQKVVKLESQPEYEETVPANVRAANLEKVMCFLDFFMIWVCVLMIFRFILCCRGRRLRLNWKLWKLRRICL